MKKPFYILDTTLRDGSYVNNFSFKDIDLMKIVSGLEEIGTEYIEIGHGIGLGATEKGMGIAAQTDEEYMRAARNTLKKSKYGMFCIPGVAELKHIDLAQEYSMDFIRIGTDVGEVESSKSFIEKAKKAGMYVMANYMKSYVSSPKEFAEKVLMSESYGADVVYIVDSAGGMFSEDIEQYYEAIRKVSNIKVGFHGHNNLGQAVSNSIKAVDLGMDFIDGSLQGMGRSAGNAATELLIAAFKKKGYDVEYNLLKAIEIGFEYINPLLNAKGNMPLDVISGFADFHSSYMQYIQKYSAKYSVNPLNLIIELCKVDKVNVDEEQLNKISQQMQSDTQYLGKYKFNWYIGGEQNVPKSK